MSQDQVQVKQPVDEKTLFVPAEGDWVPKPLSLAGSIKLTRLIGWVLVRAAIDPTKNASEVDIMTILELLDEDTLRKLFALILGKEEGWVEEHWSLKNAISCLAIFWQNEGLGETLSAAAKWASRQPTLQVPTG